MITIRQATIEDIPFLRAMIREALAASPTFLAHHSPEALQQAEEEGWQRWRAQPSPAFIAINDIGQSLGAITLRPDEVTGQGWQIGMGVVAQVRGQGIGQHLMERAITHARESYAPYLVLLVDPLNAPARALYQRTGFIEVGVRDNVIEMRLDLSYESGDMISEIVMDADFCRDKLRVIDAQEGKTL